MKRVVVTGVGAVTPVGLDAPSTWAAMLEGQSGVGKVTHFDASDYPVQIAGEVKGFDATGRIEPKELRRMDRYAQLAVISAQEAWADAGLTRNGVRDEIGVIYGSAAGGLGVLIEQQRVLTERGPKRVSPTFIQNMLTDTASGHIAIALGLRGPNMAVVSACATGSGAVGEAFETIRRGDASAIVSGGSEAALVPLIYAGFNAMRALAQHEDPTQASRPFDRDRNGFVISEGAGALVLEDLDHARQRGARIYAEVVGYGSSNDAFDMAAPAGGDGAFLTMERALRKAEFEPARVDYINAHGTGTPLNDKFETDAIHRVFGKHAERLAVSSTKSMTGHMMGASGAVEAVVCALTIRDQIIAPTINLQNPDPECDLDYVPGEARRARVDVALSNSFGLGGHNASVILARLAD
ncbi:MAG: beta-ketoacyl-ACP synthase II [Chloroflexi bacterium]|nr:MAG: beta-ketoacyl-ACP synthase II [Chloroflexota bacterium]TME48150.1 MAG: beta-ketoacyl-ACP synthase II [Chloroflexota bacterium]